MTPFEELVRDRQDWIEANDRPNNCFDFETMLSGNYRDPSHFVFELLQNAENAGATQIAFQLHADRLEIKHNGIAFSIDNVNCITAIGKSTWNKPNPIGKFGLGFKSVFRVTDSPEVHSGEFHFRIEKMILPVAIPAYQSDDGTTLFRFPFKYPSQDFRTVSKCLKSVDPATVLFLSSLRSIAWEIAPSNIRGSITSKKKGHHREFIEVEESRNGKTNKHKYLLFRGTFQYSKQTYHYAIAFLLSKEGRNEYITPIHDAKYWVYFPTQVRSDVGFLIHAPFKTTPNREDIPFEDEENQRLLDKLIFLLTDSLVKIKELGFLTPEFLRTLPVRSELCSSLEYSMLFAAIKNALSGNTALLPTSQKGVYTTAASAMFAGSSKLTKLLRSEDLNVLFGRASWIDNTITTDRDKILYPYMRKDLQIPEEDLESFSKAINQTFLESRTDEWLCQFYEFIQSESRGIRWIQPNSPLMKKPIIRLEDGEHITPFDQQGRNQVYLPAKEPTIHKTVKRSIVENKSALKFLKAIGLTEPDLIAEVRDILIPKYHQDGIVTAEDFEKDMRFLLAVFDKHKDRVDEILQQLKKTDIILAENSQTREIRRLKPPDVYLRSPELEAYFGETLVYYARDVKTIEEDKYNALLVKLGCQTLIRRIQFDPQFDSENKKRLRNDQYSTRDISCVDYKLDGLDHFISREFGFYDSAALWSLLLKQIAKLSEWRRRNWFYGEYKWQYYNVYSKTFPSHMLKLLKDSEWLFKETGERCRPSDICLEDLSTSFNRNSDSVDFISSILGFQQDEVRRIEEKYGKKMVDAEEYERFKQFERDQQEKATSAWTPEVLADEVPVKEIEEYKPPNKRKEKHITGGGGGGALSTTQNGASEQPTESPGKSTDIGRWGEEFVFRSLKDKGNMVEWLNEQTDAHQHYDIEMTDSNGELHYIEVKSKIYDDEEHFRMSGSQWQFASEKGSSYSIYLVSNAGKKNDSKIKRIRDPYSLWKEGKIFASPVNIRL